MTKIAWTEKTWNPIIGCSKVSPGCKNCYAERMAGRLANMGNIDYMGVVPRKSGTGVIKHYKKAIYLQTWNGKTVFVESALTKPLHWKKPRMIFACSMGDLFHESVPFGWIEKIMQVIHDCPQHTFQVLTKRPHIMAEYFNGLGKRFELSCLQNLWLGVTAENQEQADKRIPILLQIPAAKRFVSCEPLLGPVDVASWGWRNTSPSDSRISWIICGAESGPGRRKCEWAWPESIVQQCKEADVPCFVKQIHAIDSLELIKEPVGWPREFPVKEQ